jgi:hypothetical protein
MSLSNLSSLLVQSDLEYLLHQLHPHLSDLLLLLLQLDQQLPHLSDLLVLQDRRLDLLLQLDQQLRCLLL